MMIRVPGLTDKGMRTTAFTEHIDLFPTLAEMAAGVKLPPCPTGRSQVRVLDRRELPDGTRRAKIGQHEERLNSPRRMGTPAPSAEEVLVLGWVSCAGKDGRENLIVEWRK